AVSVLEEDSVAATNGCLAVAHGIPRETNSRSRIKQMTLHTTHRNTGRYAALHDSVRQIRERHGLRRIGTQANHIAIGVNGRLARNVTPRIEVVCLVVSLAVGAKQADSHPEIQRQSAGRVPIILEVGLQVLEAVVVFDVTILLSKAGDSAQQQVSKRISR